MLQISRRDSMSKQTVIFGRDSMAGSLSAANLRRNATQQCPICAHLVCADSVSCEKNFDKAYKNFIAESLGYTTIGKQPAQLPDSVKEVLLEKSTSEHMDWINDYKQRIWGT